jgi:hypothetical protein
MGKIYNSLKEYFENTPKEQLDKDWEEIEPLNNIGVDVLEWAEFAKKIKPLDSDISQWVDKNFDELI